MLGGGGGGRPDADSGNWHWAFRNNWYMTIKLLSTPAVSTILISLNILQKQLGGCFKHGSPEKPEPFLSTSSVITDVAAEDLYSAEKFPAIGLLCCSP